MQLKESHKLISMAWRKWVVPIFLTCLLIIFQFKRIPHYGLGYHGVKSLKNNLPTSRKIPRRHSEILKGISGPSSGHVKRRAKKL